EMDCDFSHDPNDVPRLIAATDDADLALGSRYVEGGEVADWGVVRRAVSAAGSFYARVALSLQIRDLTGGFKCYRADVLRTIDLDAIDSKGYAFQIETTYRALRAGFRVVEVPIRFVDRVLAELGHEHEGKIAFAKLNIDENIETASRFSVLSIPTTILFEGGRPQETVVGARPRAHYERAWARWLTSSTP